MASSVSKISETLKINGSTPVREFPEDYNALITTLNQKIEELNRIIAERDAQIAQLQNQISSGLKALRAEFLATQDQLNNN